MNRLLLSAALVCLMGGQISAQTRQVMPVRQHKVHKSPLTARPDAAKTKKLTATQPETSSCKLKLAPTAPAPETLKKEAYLPYDTLLCTAHVKQLNGKTVLDQQVEYDEYGLYRMITNVDEKNKTETRYTYCIGKDNYWTSRLVEQRVNGGSWEPINKEERTINDEEQLTSVKQYILYNDGQIRLTHWYEYDYSHEFVREGKTYRGALTREVHYNYERNSDGTETCVPNYEQNYVWFEPAKDYICTLLAYDYTKETTQFEGNNTVTNHYYIDTSTNDSILSKTVTNYYGQTEDGLQIEGNLYVMYDIENGEISWVDGDKIAYKGLAPQGKIVQGQDYEKREYKCSDSSLKWYETTHQKGHWLNNNLLEILNVRYGYNDYRLFNDEGMDINSEEDEKYDVEYDSKLQQFTVYYGDLYNGEDGFIDVYNLQNELISRFRQQSKDLGLSQKGFKNEYNEIQFLGFNMSEWKDGQWLPRTAPMEFYETGETGEFDERGVYYFNEKGDLVKEEWYDVTPEDPVGTLNERTVYSYQENETKATCVFDRDDTDGGQYEEWLKRLADGNYEYASLDYRGNRIAYGDYILYDVAQGYAKTYHCSYDNWSEPSYTYVDLVSVDPETGIESRISRKHDERTNQPVYTYKTEKKDDPETGYHLEASYVWNSVRNIWEGETKTITEPRSHDVPILPVRYPTRNDDYSHYPAAPQQDFNQTANSSDMNHATYKWKWSQDEKGQVTGDWSFDYIDYQKVLPLEDGGYYIEIEKSDPARYYMYKYWVELNDQQRIVKLQNLNYANEQFYDREHNKFIWKENSIRKDMEFIHNEQGFTTEVKTIPYKPVDNSWIKTGEVWTDLYTFTAAQVTPTEIDEVKTHDEAFTRNGREISTAGQTLITVYDLSGRKVAEATGSLTLPGTGIYLVNCNGKTTKVCCR